MANIKAGTPAKVVFPKPGTADGFDITLGAAVVVGDEIVVGNTGWQGVTGAVISGVSDDLGNTYEMADTIVRNTNQHRAYLWRAIVTNAGTPVITLDFADDGNAGGFVGYACAIEGLANDAIIDTAVAQNANPSTEITTGSVTVGVPAVLVVMAMAVDMSGSIEDDPDGYTTILENDSPDSGDYGTFLFREVVAGTYDAVIDVTANSDAPISVIMALPSSGGGGGSRIRANLRGNLANLSGGLIS